MTRSLSRLVSVIGGAVTAAGGCWVLYAAAMQIRDLTIVTPDGASSPLLVIVLLIYTGGLGLFGYVITRTLTTRFTAASARHSTYLCATAGGGLMSIGAVHSALTLATQTPMKGDADISATTPLLSVALLLYVLAAYTLGFQTIRAIGRGAHQLNRTIHPTIGSTQPDGRR